MRSQPYDPISAHVAEAATDTDLFDRFARHYDGDYRDYDDDVDLILALAGECGGPVLELGCGTGRVMQPLVSAGYAVTGVDVSPKLLAIAEGKLGRLRPDASYDLQRGDLTDFDLPRKDFRLVILASNTLMHLTTPQEQTAALANARRHLEQDGTLLVDLFNPDVVRLVAVNGVVEFADEWHDDALGVHVVKWSVRTVDFSEQLQDTLFLYEETGADGLVRRTVCPFVLRFLWRNEAELMLRECGFAVEEVWGNFEGEPYGAESERLILLARKT